MTGYRACYRKLNKYKYQLVQSYITELEIRPTVRIEEKYFALSTSGELVIKDGYAWDGASWCPDVRCIMRGALVHDVLYQMLRMSLLPQTSRDTSDRVLQRICIEDGMAPLVARGVYLAVHKFGKQAARPTAAPQDELVYVP